MTCQNVHIQIYADDAVIFTVEKKHGPYSYISNGSYSRLAFKIMRPFKHQKDGVHDVFSETI